MKQLSSSLHKDKNKNENTNAQSQVEKLNFSFLVSSVLRLVILLMVSAFGVDLTAACCVSYTYLMSCLLVVMVACCIRHYGVLSGPD